MCTDGGAAAVRKDAIGFARIQWETWSPSGWFDDAEFAQTADSFSSPDWAAITLNAYRARWRQSEAEGLEAFFTRGYRRVVLENVGHFPHREAPGLVAEAVLDHFHQSIKP